MADSIIVKTTSQELKTVKVQILDDFYYGVPESTFAMIQHKPYIFYDFDKTGYSKWYPINYNKFVSKTINSPVSVISIELPIKIVSDVVEISFYGPDKKRISAHYDYAYDATNNTITLNFIDTVQGTIYVFMRDFDTQGDVRERFIADYGVTLDTINNENYMILDMSNIKLDSDGKLIVSTLDVSASSIPLLSTSTIAPINGTEEVNLSIRQTDGSIILDPIANKQFVVSKIETEELRAKTAEDNLNIKVDVEIVNRTEIDNQLLQSINAETDLRLANDNQLYTAMIDEITRATSAEEALQTNITTETITRTSHINQLQIDIETEYNRATLSETTLNTKIDDLNQSLNSDISAANIAIVSETNRAKNAEISLQTSLDAEILSRTNNDTQIISIVNTKANQETTYTKLETDDRIQTIIGAAPAALDTLAEIATQLSNDETAVASLTTTVSTKAPLDSPSFTGTVSGISKTMVGLENVDNTSDANKPISIATQNALSTTVSSVTQTTMMTELNMNAYRILSPVFDRYSEIVTSLTISQPTLTLNCQGGSQFYNMVLDTTITSLTVNGGMAANTAISITMILNQGTGGNKTITWPASFKWEGGVKPVLSTTAGAIDVVSAISYDRGVTYLAFLTAKGMI